MFMARAAVVVAGIVFAAQGSAHSPAEQGNTAAGKKQPDTAAALQLNPRPEIAVINVQKAIAADKLTDKEPFKRTYLGHARHSSVFVFQGHKGPFKSHVHVTHDEIGYVLSGSGKVNVGGRVHDVRVGDAWIIPANTPHSGEFLEPTTVLFFSSPQDAPEHPDRVWLEQ